MDIYSLFTLQDGFVLMLVRFAICAAVNFIIVDKLYYRKSRRRDFYFTFMLISVAIFFLVYFMIYSFEDMKAKTSMGIGIGLFGIFSIIRYRTDAMPVREMTYLFLIIALSVINAMAGSMSLLEIIIADILVVLSTWACESFLKVYPAKLVQYDRIELITPDRRVELLDDLKERTGLDIVKVEVGAVDFIRDMAVIKIYYNLPSGVLSPDVDGKTRLTREDNATV